MKVTILGAALIGRRIDTRLLARDNDVEPFDTDPEPSAVRLPW